MIHHEDLLWGDRADLALLNGKLAEWLLCYHKKRPPTLWGLLRPSSRSAESASLPLPGLLLHATTVKIRAKAGYNAVTKQTVNVFA